MKKIVNNIIRPEGVELLKYGSPRWFDVQDFPNEIWKEIPNFEGIYAVSNYGRIKSFSYVKNLRKGNPYIKERILKTPTGKNGYQHVILYKKNEHKTYSLHKLVASVFEIKRVCDGDVINHIDENKENNRVDNLEWCSASYNINYGTAQKRHRDTREVRGLLRAVVKMDMNGVFLKRFRSIHEAAEEVDAAPNNVWACCVGKYSQCKGNRYCYESDYK